MQKKPAPAKLAPSSAGPDPRFAPVVKALSKSPGFSLMESKSGAMRGMMFDGKSFGMSSHGRLILKLTDARAAALVDAGAGKPFSPTAGKVMKGWIEVTDPSAKWVALAKEAYGIAAAGGATRPVATKPPGKPKRASAAPARSPEIDAYLAAAASDRRAALEELRRTIHAILPKAEECISYKMPAFRLDGSIVAGFQATAKGCSYYPFSGSTLRTLAKDLESYPQTKSALHFGSDVGLPVALVRKLIKARVAETR